MAATKVTMSLNLGGSGTYGPVGPRTFKREVVAQGLSPEFNPVPVGAADVDRLVTIPTMTGQRFVLIATTEPVKYRVNAELTADDKDIEINGFVVLPSTPIVTQIKLTGNGTTAADVYVLAVGS